MEIEKSLSEKIAEFDLKRSQMTVAELVRDDLMQLDYMCCSPLSFEALRRLAFRADALAAWTKLRALSCVDGRWNFSSVVYWVGRDAVACFDAPTDTRTASEIRRATERASKLAEELASLIEKNNELQFIDHLLMPTVEEAALDRLTRGIVLSGAVFSEEIEKKLDVHQARDFPDFKGMTTRQATNEIDYGYAHRNGFLHRLKMFSSRAKNLPSYPLPLSRPNAKSAKQHNYALTVCSLFDTVYRSPRIEIAAALTSAVFDEVIDADTVKKWWQRKSKYWDDGDTSEEF